ncbi:Calmodulin [Symbiodinium sp. KB8]|nr:Calmodulin [Symbiodinium sp. KB8]
MGQNASHLQSARDEAPQSKGSGLASELSFVDVRPAAEEQGPGDEQRESGPESQKRIPDKFQRLAMLGHLEVDTEIARGLSLRESLRQGGRLWLTAPGDLSDKSRAELWSRSRPVQHFDMFISHTWKTSGKWKLLSLLFHSGSQKVLVIWFTTVIAVLSLTILGVLPAPWRIEAHAMEFKAMCPVGPWIELASFVATFAGFIASPYLPSMPRPRDTCFLDVASIHQTDQRLMERGVYGIGGFLRISRELRVLWSTPYLSRLWCVFELAAFRTANPEGKITLAPLFVETILAAVILWEYFVTVIYWSTRASQVGEVYNSVSYLFAMLPCCFAMHMIRRSHMAKHKLFSDLEHFDLGKVQCSNDFDKDFIHAAIVRWYGGEEAFTAFVRGPLREELLGARPATLLVAYPLLLLSPAIASSLTFLAGLWRGGAPVHCLLSYVMGSFLGFNILWVFSCLSLFLYLCDHFAEPRWPGIFDHLQTLLFISWSSASAWNCTCVKVLWFSTARLLPYGVLASAVAMARSRSPAVRRLLIRGTAGIDDIFLSPLTTDEKRRCRCLEVEGKYCSDDEDSVEEPSSSSVDDMEEHKSQLLERVGRCPSQDDIEDFSQVDVSSSGPVEFAGVPPCILEQLSVAANRVPSWRLDGKALDLRLDRQEALIQELLCREEFEAWAAPAAQPTAASQWVGSVKGAFQGKFGPRHARRPAEAFQAFPGTPVRQFWSMPSRDGSHAAKSLFNSTVFPFAEALMKVADEHIAFTTAESGGDGMLKRMTAVENGLLELKSMLQTPTVGKEAETLQEPKDPLRGVLCRGTLVCTRGVARDLALLTGRWVLCYDSKAYAPRRLVALSFRVGSQLCGQRGFHKRSRVLTSIVLRGQDTSELYSGPAGIWFHARAARTSQTVASFLVPCYGEHCFCVTVAMMRIGAALQATRLDLVLLIDLPSDETPSSMCASKL